MTISRLTRSVLACAAMLAGTVSWASPVTVSVRGNDYSISTVMASQDSPEPIFGQVWWGDSDLARDFASALGDQLGQPNNQPVAGGYFYGPLFAFDGPYPDLTGVGGQDGGPNLVAWTYQKQLYDGVTIRYPVYYNAHVYAVATRVVDPGVVPEPSTLALAGLAAVALAGSRRRHVSPVPRRNPTSPGPNGTKCAP